MKKLFLALLLLVLLAPVSAQAFCGFYVAKADSKLFNKASKVVLAYNQGRAVITMANDFQGAPSEFAIVIPVPTSISKEQVHVTSNALIDHLDSYTAPRLVEYFDENPCSRMRAEMMMKSAAPSSMADGAQAERAKSLGVKIEAQYTVGEYDIAILSAEQSSGLATYLNENGYKIPANADRILGSYIKQQMRFFVAKVNLDEQAKLGFSYLRPLQVAYNSPKFMLPIRLGTLNAPPVEVAPMKARDVVVLHSRPDRTGSRPAENEAIYNDGSQDLILMVLSRNGRVEPTNYRTVKIDSEKEVPLFVKDDFANFYRSMFQRRAKAEGSAVFLEYAWDMGWCDPCAADPLRPEQLKELGVFWLDEPEQDPSTISNNAVQNNNMPNNNMIGGMMLPNGIAPKTNMPLVKSRPRPPIANGGVNTFVTRLHARYNAQTFPEDLMLQETSDRTNFQGRFIMRHPWNPGNNPSPENSCEQARMYMQSLPTRYAHEAENLARMTGWSIDSIREKMAANGQGLSNAPVPPENKEFWKNIWPDDKK